MKHFSPKLMTIAILGAITLSACGGGGGGSAPAAPASFGGVASKGIVNGGLVTAYCGGKIATPQVSIGTATTAADGSYTITPTQTCNVPVEVVLSFKTGATMFDEATAKFIPMPATFTLSAWIANPGSTVTAHITPFTDMAAAVIDASKTLPSAASVSAAINAVVTTVLNGDTLLYNAKPMNPLDANDPSKNSGSDASEVKKLATLLTAISAKAHYLAGEGDVGAATITAVEELRNAGTSTMTVNSDGTVSTKPPTSGPTPATILTGDLGDSTDISDVNTKTFENSNSASVTPVTTTVGTGTITATTPGILAAKALFTSLRSNIVQLSNSRHVGFLDTQLSDIRGDFHDLGHTVNGINDFITSTGTAENLLSSATNLSYDSSGNYTQFGKSGSCTINLSSHGVVNCTWGFNGTNNSDGSFSYSRHLTTFSLTTGVTPGTSFDWSDVIQTTTYQAYSGVGVSPSPVVTTSPATSQTGTATNTSHTSGNAITFNGSVAGLDSTADHTKINITATENLNADASGHTILALTGSVINQGSANNALLTLNVASGSQVVAIPGTLTTSAQPVSANIVITASSPNYEFDGSLSIPSLVQDTSKMYTAPASMVFNGSVTNLASATVGKFMTGKLTLTEDLTSYDVTNHVKSSSNFQKITLLFNGTIANNTVTPVANYGVNISVDGTVYNSTSISFTYTDPSKTTITVSGTQSLSAGAPPMTLTATSGTGGITVVFTKGAGGSVYSGDPANRANLIGTISGKQVNFTDGSFDSLN